jgi:methyltransferase
VTLFHIVIVFVVLERAAELWLSHVNTVRLKRLGAAEIDRVGYKWFIALHAAWLAALAFGVPAKTSPNWTLLGIFGLLQFARVWVIASLGRRWTTRLIVLGGAPLVRSGPYRWLDHPNYIVVAAEVAILPLTFAAVAIAVVFSACNALLVARRIRLENAALRGPSHLIRETLPRRNSL